MNSTKRFSLELWNVSLLFRSHSEHIKHVLPLVAQLRVLRLSFLK